MRSKKILIGSALVLAVVIGGIYLNSSSAAKSSQCGGRIAVTYRLLNAIYPNREAEMCRASSIINNLFAALSITGLGIAIVVTRKEAKQAKQVKQLKQ